ncbi:MAG: hypothetical protein ACXVB9_14775 [Bdellovibrionota bacterium]
MKTLSNVLTALILIASASPALAASQDNSIDQVQTVCGFLKQGTRTTTCGFRGGPATPCEVGEVKLLNTDVGQDLTVEQGALKDAMEAYRKTHGMNFPSGTGFSQRICITGLVDHLDDGRPYQIDPENFSAPKNAPKAAAFAEDFDEQPAAVSSAL